MKKTFLFTSLSVIILLLTTVSCYDDNSTLDVNTISEVVIDTTGVSKLSVFQFEQLQVNPNLDLGGLAESDLSYEWYLNFSPNDTVFALVGEQRNLDYEVRLPPNRAGKNHLLYYKVTDNQNNLTYSVAWPLTVKNNIGEGLVIAETSNGLTTDISHIMSPEVTPNYTGESVKHHVYSAINFTTFDGLIKQLHFTTIYGVDAILGITDNSMIRINTLDYTFGGKNEDLFFDVNPNLQAGSLNATIQTDVFVGNGKLTPTYLGVSTKFGLPMDSNYQVPAEIALNGFNVSSKAVILNFYDELNESFIYLPTFRFGDTQMKPIPGSTTGVFNPENVKNKENVAANVSNTGDFRHLLRDKTTNELTLYVLDGGVYEYPSPIPPAPKSMISLAGAPEIDNATDFVFLEDQRVLYYATNNKIYAMLYSSNTPSFELKYTVPAGEEITTLQVYRQAGYPYDGRDANEYIATNNKQLILSTYDGSEGRVSILPLINFGVGNIDVPNIKTFNGFDLITAIGTQK